MGLGLQKPKFLGIKHKPFGGCVKILILEQKYMVRALILRS